MADLRIVGTAEIDEVEIWLHRVSDSVEEIHEVAEHSEVPHELVNALSWRMGQLNVAWDNMGFEELYGDADDDAKEAEVTMPVVANPATDHPEPYEDKAQNRPAKRPSAAESEQILSDPRTGAEFRAMRETIGYTQRECGMALGYADDQAVKRWENPKTGWDVRPFAWEWMDRMVAQHNADVDELLAKADKFIDAQPDGFTGPIRIAYFRNGMHSEEPAGALDAVARDAGRILASEGYSIRYVWVTEDPDALM